MRDQIPVIARGMKITGFLREALCDGAVEPWA
jgi:hypothetical protein